MKEQFANYEISLKLKELGFNEMCFGTFDEDGHFDPQDFEQNYDTLPSYMIATPLWQQVIDWFREKYDIDITIMIRFASSYGVIIHKNRNIPKNFEEIIIDPNYNKNTYYEARKKAVLKALELCKQ